MNAACDDWAKPIDPARTMRNRDTRKTARRPGAGRDKEVVEAGLKDRSYCAQLTTRSPPFAPAPATRPVGAIRFPEIPGAEVRQAEPPDPRWVERSLSANRSSEAPPIMLVKGSPRERNEFRPVANLHRARIGLRWIEDNMKRKGAHRKEKGETTPSQLIDARIEELGDWRGETLARVRDLVKQADPEVVEEWKWRGVPVWEHDGIVCTGETYKKVVKMTFAKGASLEDPSGLFNSSLEGNTRRAIDLHEGDEIDEEALKALVRAAVALNAARAS